MLPKVTFQDLNHISYQAAWDYQFAVQKQVIERKAAVRAVETDASVFSLNLKQKQQNYLLFCEHNPVFTLGKSGSINNLLFVFSKW